MYKLGKKNEAKATEPSKDKIWYPSVCLTSSEDISEFNKKIDSKIAFKAVGILKSVRKEGDGYSYEIELKGCEPTTEVDEGEYDKMTDEEKDKIDRQDVEEKSMIDDNEE